MATKNDGKKIYFKIEKARGKKFLTRKALAEKINMSPQNFYDTMNGLLKNNIRYHNLIKIANFLEIDLGIRI